LPGPYDGVHVFGFLFAEDGFPLESVIQKLQRFIDREKGPVFFAGTCKGAFQGFVHVAADDVRGIGKLTDGLLWDAGIRTDYAVESQTHENNAVGPKGPRRKSPGFNALCRVHANQRPTQVLQNIADRFGDAVDDYGESSTPFIGGSTVIGRFHLLVQLGADDRKELDRHVELLGAVDGVDRIDVAVSEEGPKQAA
jgi:hypothetical protein